jgi:hypothetical protein
MNREPALRALLPFAKVLGDFHTGTKLFIISFWALIFSDWHGVTFSRFSGGVYENITLLQAIRVCYSHTQPVNPLLGPLQQMQNY